MYHPTSSNCESRTPQKASSKSIKVAHRGFIDRLLDPRANWWTFQFETNVPVLLHTGIPNSKGWGKERSTGKREADETFPPHFPIHRLNTKARQGRFKFWWQALIKHFNYQRQKKNHVFTCLLVRMNKNITDLTEYSYGKSVSSKWCKTGKNENI